MTKYTLTIHETYGRVDYIDANDRKLQEDASGSGSEWFPEYDTEEIIELDADNPELDAAERLMSLGLTEDNGHWFSSPDGPSIVNYSTAQECETIGTVQGFSDEEMQNLAAKVIS